ncbi:hypothetical protein ACN28I_01505 [Archangium gephyra]
MMSRKYELIVSGAAHEDVEAVGEGGQGSGGAEPRPDKRMTVGSLRR